MNELNGKKALVTGAAQGIGRAIAEALALQGAKVIATDINEKAFPEDSENLKFRHLNVTDDAQVAKVIKEESPEILVNVAGMVHHGTILECTDEHWDQALTLNTRSSFKICQAALPAMVQRKDGCIVNISSVASSIKGVPVRFAYSVSKAALLGLTKSLAADFVKHGIRVNAICPGTVRSPSWEQRVRELADSEGITEQEATKRFEDRQPLGRVGEVTEIAQMVALLASKAGSFTTGQEICIDGGWSTL